MKPTVGGRAHIGSVVEAPPYPGARPSFLIEERLEDAEWLSEVVRITTREPPAPGPKKRRQKRQHDTAVGADDGSRGRTVVPPYRLAVLGGLTLHTSKRKFVTTRGAVVNAGHAAHDRLQVQHDRAANEGTDRGTPEQWLRRGGHG